MSASGKPRFQEEVTTEAQLRQIIGEPAGRAVDKVINRIDRHAREFIELSPFVLVASGGGQGDLDISPKGDPPGFVRVLNQNTVVIPDRPGNRRADTFLNVLREPAVALLFMIPGKAETLRVSGRATIVRDVELRRSLSVQFKPPELALVVSVREVFFHCARCVIRSRLWQSESWPDSNGLASHAQCIVDHARLAERVEAVQAALDSSYRDQLY
jgi:PPOX class probable FMN-dependent enzyme